MSPLQLAKTFYSIPVLCREIYPDWREPRRPGEACSAPYRQDRKPSFSIIPGSAGRLAHDFGEGKTYDAVSFHARALGLSLPDAAKDLIRRYRARGGSAAPPAPISPATPPAAWQSSKTPVLPPMDEGTREDRLALARLRCVCLAAVELLISRGLLRFCGDRGQRAWVITDSSRRSAQRRLLSGKPWYNDHKVIGFRGVSNRWPVGLGDAARRQRIAVVEGTGDMLAAAHFSVAQHCEEAVGIVGLLGVSVQIPPEAIPLFKNRPVRFFVHLDPGGQGMKAARRWAEQISGTAGHIDGVTFENLMRLDRTAVEDLNDLTRVDPDSYEAHRDFIDGIMDF